MLTYLILGAGIVVLIACASIACEVREKPGQLFRYQCQKCGARYADPELLGQPWVCANDDCNGSLVPPPGEFEDRDERDE